jgi:hypothetical protein
MTLDTIFYRKRRTLNTIPDATMQTAISIARRFSLPELELVLKRLLDVSRPKLNPKLPSVTEAALTQWDLVCRMITPDEGFQKWYERACKNEQSRVLSLAIKRAQRNSDPRSTT